MMKILIILLIAALPVTGFCQSNGKQVIKIAGISLEQLIRGFLDAGYSIEKSEASMSVIVTHLKEAQKSNVATQIKAKIKDGNVLLSGEYIESGKDQNPSPITDAGVPGSPCSESWNMMHDFAQSFKKPLEIQ
ncbi:hypothetical protein [Agriterribacter sp.]|uniref:hypothetical protein n=1 Tax=Agriterribacter sp. TaxID=2821509 RepID=UPI002B898850|nr:hypothetical protein [Agriterribacter sp.]HRO47618.1 hypothetical protein [Agriterribacter sp.]HRQ17178.1 hypothetical protein [Agriterribacter sp.]